MPKQGSSKRLDQAEHPSPWRLSLIGMAAVGAFAAFLGFGGYLMTQGQDLGSQLNRSFSRAATAAHP
ncbi:hypothetical protein [Acidisoma sp. C75]